MTITSAILAIAAFALSIAGFIELSQVGLPDGHVTEYDKATVSIRAIFLASYLALGLCLLRLLIPGLAASVKAARFVIAICALVFLVVSTEVAVPWYFADHLGLDNGHGG